MIGVLLGNKLSDANYKNLAVILASSTALLPILISPYVHFQLKKYDKDQELNEESF